MQAIEESVKPVNMLLEISLLKELEEYLWASRTKTRTQAIRDLLRLGLEAYYKSAKREKR